jgi:hypothetical protein
VSDDTFGAALGVLRRDDWSPAERIAVVLLIHARNGHEDVSCLDAYGDAGLDHGEADAFVGAVAPALGATAAYSEDGHVLLTWSPHARETGHPIEITEQRVCGHPDCGNVLDEMTYRTDRPPPAPVAGGSDAPRHGKTATRAARKRARQARKRGRR